MKFSRRLGGFLRQRILVVLIILLQIAFVVVTTVFNSHKWEILSGLLGAISFFVALYVVNSRDKAAYKVSLVFLILLFPIFGGLFYILFKGTVPYRAMHKKLLETERRIAEENRFLTSAKEAAMEAFPSRTGQLRYLCDYAGFPVAAGSETEYFPSGELALPVMLEEMKRRRSISFLSFSLSTTARCGRASWRCWRNGRRQALTSA